MTDPIRLLQAGRYNPFLPATHDGQGLLNFDPSSQPLFSHNTPTIPEKVWGQHRRYDFTVLNVADFIIYLSQIEDISGLSFFSDSIDINQCRALWDSLRPWLKEQGYNLYSYLPGHKYENPHTSFFGEQMHPFAYYVREYHDTIDDQPEYPFSFSTPSKVRRLTSCCYIHPITWDRGYVQVQFAYAQDEAGRHVIVKPVQENTAELKILECLLNEKSLLDSTKNIGVYTGA